MALNFRRIRKDLAHYATISAGILATLYGTDSIRSFKPSFGHQNPERGIRIAESGSHLYGSCAHFLVWYPSKAKLAEVVAEQK